VQFDEQKHLVVMTSSTVVKVSVLPIPHSVLAVIGRVVSAALMAALNCAASTPPSASPISQPTSLQRLQITATFEVEKLLNKVSVFFGFC
jgi:hypothetical protein